MRRKNQNVRSKNGEKWGKCDSITKVLEFHNKSINTP